MNRHCAALLVLAVGACTELPPELEAACTELGVCDPERPAPMAIDIGCDPSDGSSCSRRSAEETLSVALDAIADRPGSLLRVWAIGPTVAEIVLVFEVIVPELPARASTASRHRSEFRTETLAGALDALEPVCSSGPEQRGSPLSDAITRIAAEDASGLPRTIVLVSDGREHRPGIDFERGRLPTETRFLANLVRRRVLEPASLATIRIHFAFLTLRPLARRSSTDVSLGRRAAIVDLWRAALERAGASEIGFSTGTPHLDSNDLDDSSAGTVPGAEEDEDRIEGRP